VTVRAVFLAVAVAALVAAALLYFRYLPHC
jgi:hypothetical protein